jgi:DNA repair exonuclease SbcCD ATPase subunit
MILKYLEEKNFIVFEDISMSLGEEAFFITGQNNDKVSSTSNGAGKSTLCQSIVWCLFDDILRKGMLKDGVIGPFQDWCQVCLTVEKDERQIVIDRVRNHPDRGHDVKIFIDGEDKSLHSVADNNAYIERLLSVSSSIVYYCAYTDNAKEPLVSLTSASLHKVVSEILNVERFDDYIKEIKSVKKQKEAEHLSLVRDIVSEQTRLEGCEKDIIFLRSEIQSFETKQKKLISDLKEQIAATEVEVRDYETILSKKESLHQEYNVLSIEMKSLERTSSALKSLKVKRTNADSGLASCVRRFHLAEAELEKAEEGYDNIFNNISGQCQFCGHEIAGSKHLNTYASQISNRRNNAKADLIDAEIDMQQKQVEVQKLGDEIVELEARLEMDQEVVVKFNKLKNKLEALEKVQSGLDYCNKVLKQTKDHLKAAVNDSATGLKANLREKENLLSVLRDSIAEKTAAASVKEREAKACSALEQAVKQTKTAVFNSFILDLQEKINENLDMMTGGEYHCSFHEKGGELAMVFTDSSKNGKYLPYSVFSTGERARISKASSMALNEMLDVGFMIDDEGLEGLDTEGSVSVLDFVLAKASGRTLFFVSHSPVVKDHLTVGFNIHVTKENGCSSIEIKKN